MNSISRRAGCIALDIVFPHTGRATLTSSQSHHRLLAYLGTSVPTFCSALHSYGISSLTETGRQKTMAKRLVDSTKTTSADQKFDFFLVLDFEATCDNRQKPNPQEIIEFPVLKFNARTQTVDSVYHHYVLPQYHPLLTPFCSELTGIVQDMVSGQPHLPQVLQSFDEWMKAEGLLNSEVKSTFVTCGDWDLKIMLPKQCAVLNLSHKNYFHKWINIKKSFADITGTFPKGLMDMLTHLDVKHEGRHHSGIDDCRNICNILKALLHKGYVFKENSRM